MELLKSLILSSAQQLIVKTGPFLLVKGESSTVRSLLGYKYN